MSRWTPQRKHALCLAIFDSQITPEAAICEHGLSPEELDEWLRDTRKGEREGRSYAAHRRNPGYQYDRKRERIQASSCN